MSDEPATLPPGTTMLHRNVALLESDDPAELAALLANPRVASLVAARIGDRAALITPEAAHELHATLKRAGVSVTLVGEFGD